MDQVVKSVQLVYIICSIIFIDFFWQQLKSQVYNTKQITVLNYHQSQITKKSTIVDLEITMHRIEAC